MADDGQNNDQMGDDEYQFADLDALGSDQDAVSLPEDEPLEGAQDGVSSPPGRGRFDNLDPKVVTMIRNGAISVAALILVLVVYKGLGSFFSSKSKTDTKKLTPMATTTPTRKPTSQVPIPIRTSTSASDRVSTSSEEAVSALKQEQKRVDSELSVMRTQISTLTQNVTDISAKMTDVKQTMLVLSERLEQQSQQMARVQSVNRARRQSSSQPPARRKPAAPKPTYSIQAIIPGRAWLMSNQGKTLTVSRGSVVPGYGAVRVINSKVGRVFTSSGRVIQFSQADS
ncbi:MAG: type IVB secretion system protein IcmG/DotF [Legionellaceae bacterium]|nr:type IVB secretion system protein IcmG/DotF [Legionellaceae bacterium]